MSTLHIRFLRTAAALAAGTGPLLSFPGELSELCSGRARIVWLQAAGPEADAAVHGQPARLMGFDTHDGRGERRLRDDPAPYAKPLLTPDGEQVVFSDWRARTIHAVHFDGTGARQLADGVALAVWRDPVTGTDWVYAGTPAGEPGAIVLNIHIHAVRRFRLDAPAVSEPVWTQTPVHMDNFQLSADGRQAGGQFPWPAAGTASLPDRDWRKVGDGCWPSLAPDGASLFWIFDGAHRNLSLFRTGSDEHWMVPVSGAPGVNGFEVYHPRWSNRARYMVMTGPYTAGSGDNRIRAGGQDVEIHVGRFSPDYTRIERWARVTRNTEPDFFPDLWLAAPPEPASAGTPAGAAESKPAATRWPVSPDGLVFLWRNRSSENAFTDPASGRATVCRVEARGRARFGRHFEMAPAGGAFVAEGGAGRLTDRCAASGQLALELLVTPPAEPPTRRQPIAGYAMPGGGWNFMLGQEGRQLVFTLRAGPGKPDYELPFGALDGATPRHVLVSCLESTIACFLDGEPAGSRADVRTGHWQDGALVFGRECRADYPVEGAGAESGWKGRIEHAAVYARWMGPGEARALNAASTAGLAQRTAPPPALAVTATLLEHAAIPAPDAIAPYRRALAVGRYRVDAVAEGACAGKELLIARWAILDARALDPARFKTGHAERLRLEPFDARPELEGERLVMDSDRFDLPLYFDAGE